MVCNWVADTVGKGDVDGDGVGGMECNPVAESADEGDGDGDGDGMGLGMGIGMGMGMEMEMEMETTAVETGNRNEGSKWSRCILIGARGFTHYARSSAASHGP